MSCIRYIIVCEGASESLYLQRLQSFLNQQPLLNDTFQTPLKLIAPQQAIAGGDKFSILKKRYAATRTNHPKVAIQIWADFDLYHRNDQQSADDFITWDSLNNLKRNSSQQPRSNPSNLQGLGSFIDFLIAEIERSYPGSLEQAPAKPAQP